LQHSTTEDALKRGVLMQDSVDFTGINELLMIP